MEQSNGVSERVLLGAVFAILAYTAWIGGCTFTMVCPDGQTLDIGPATTWAQLGEHLPAPTGTDRDAGETVYEITFDGLTLEVECGSEDRVRRINLFPRD